MEIVGKSICYRARANGHKKAVSISKHGSHIDRAVCEDAAETTYIELILSDGTNKSAKILGGTCVGPHAGETICEIALAVDNKITLEYLADTIHPYPTYGFGLMQLCSEEATKRFLGSTLAKVAKFL